MQPCTSSAPQLCDNKGNAGAKSDLRLIQQLRVKIVEARNVHCGRGAGSGTRMLCLVRLDRDDLFQSSTVAKCTNPTFGDDRQLDVNGTFRQIHFYLCDVAGSGRIPRPFARCSLDKTRILQQTAGSSKQCLNSAIWLPCKPYRRHSDISGKVCLEMVYSSDGQSTAAQTQPGETALPNIKIRILDHSDLYEASGGAGGLPSGSPTSTATTLGIGSSLHAPDVYALVSVHVNGVDQTGTHKLRLPKHDANATPIAQPFAVIPLTRLLSVSQCTLLSTSDSGLGSPATNRQASGDNQQSTDTCLRVSLWHDVLGGFQSYFHGEVRVPLDPATYQPCSAPNSADGALVAWYYLKPRSGLSGDSADSGGGQLRVQVDYSLTYLLPSAHYHELCCMLCDSVTACAQCASLFPCTSLGVLDMLPRVDIEQVARPIMKVALQTERLRPLLRVTAAWEMCVCSDVNTLFRSTSFATKILSELMKFIGSQYLYTTLKPVIDKIYNENLSCEIDPSRLESHESLEVNRQHLLLYTSSVFARIVDSAHRCPQLLKDVFGDMRELTTTYFPGRVDVQRLVISSFLLMRFFSAAILNPKMFGLKKENPCASVARTLALVSKTVQRVSNKVVSERALTSKQSWMDEFLLTFMTADRARHMCRFLDRVSCGGAASDNSASGDSVNTLKEGMLIERSERTKQCLNVGWVTPRRRHVLLTENELLIYKTKGSTPIVSLPLSDVRVSEAFEHSGKQQHCMHVICAGGDRPRQLYLMAATSCELNDWLYAVRKQCTRLQQPAMAQQPQPSTSSSEPLPGHVHASSLLYDIDVDRELEQIRAIYMQHVETMKHWKNLLDNSAALPADCAAIPRDYQLQACVHGLANAQQYSDAQRARMLHRSLTDLLCALFTLEQTHREHFKRFVRQVKHGSKEHPIGDDNYLLLKSRLRELFPTASVVSSSNSASAMLSSTNANGAEQPPPNTLAPTPPTMTSPTASCSTPPPISTMKTTLSSPVMCAMSSMPTPPSIQVTSSPTTPPTTTTEPSLAPPPDRPAGFSRVE